MTRCLASRGTRGRSTITYGRQSRHNQRAPVRGRIKVATRSLHHLETVQEAENEGKTACWDLIRATVEVNKHATARNTRAYIPTALYEAQ